ncbi:hypothetical protein EYF80_015363 [Liparis tanakae]|uniref:Uncharacterized protein n=1 Tax=Liparis tanakae TaxID=230148 RepID=A0A4Z2IAS7_9TELE|nr:hypothetical protein EYF80_015363 [Liparis tanakae]
METILSVTACLRAADLIQTYFSISQPLSLQSCPPERKSDRDAAARTNTRPRLQMIMLRKAK